ncbi:ribose 5-phosphate isomerase B [Pectinatus sottacetonis]|uniref:ribose 5-phosphate isomerase B n=1 Tax=Pectinatus sottacetonis TaxID=1002795 RepID=UPI0018C72A14|nr:ribose 5-phosphate isomerase B [Pectinatus sottacetonis]
MTIVIGSDHAGLHMKEFLKGKLHDAGYVVIDKGTHDEKSVDAGTYAISVGEEVASDTIGKKGILICGTGIGMSINANKINGIRAALVGDLFSAKMTRAHNDANVICMGARVIAEAMAWEITKTWLSTEFLGGKYAKRVASIARYENMRI